MTRGFQPAHAAGLRGVVAYELEPFAIEPPPDAPWRWAIEVDSAPGTRDCRARPAGRRSDDPLRSRRLGEGTRGVQNAVTAMAEGVAPSRAT